MEKKIGLYICTGCNMGQCLDLDALARVATKEFKVPVCSFNPFLCGREGVQVIRNDLESGKVNAVVIAACSPRVNCDVFDFGNSTIVERVNLREQVVWSHLPKKYKIWFETENSGGKKIEEACLCADEDTQMMAEDSIRMGITKVQQMELPEPYLGENLVKSILVVGGGLAGLTAALESAKAGYQVTLVEKSASLGGWVKQLYKQAPSQPPYTELEETGINELVAEVCNNPAVKVYTSARIEKISGGPGMFDTVINAGGKSVSERFGAIVLATGAKAYDASKLDQLGYGSYQNVITGEMLEKMMAAEGRITRPSDGREAKSIAFIQCAGSRDPEHLPYCSATCCVESLKQSLYLKEQKPEAAVYIFYKDIRAPGHYEYLYKRVQKEGAVFIKSDIVKITEDKNFNLLIEAEDVLTGEPVVTEEIDLVVLATGMVPTTAFGDEKAVVEAGEDKNGGSSGKEDAPTSDRIIHSDILNLEYRQGPELPTLKYGFADSHFVCFPYETRRTGIYAAGSVRAPMDIPSTVEDAAGAALKAIQCVELTSRGASVHPRSGDLSFPDFFMQRCTQCKRCTEECPFGAINEDEKFNPILNPTRCRRCGTCMGACPERIISFKNYSVPMISKMIKAIEVPEEDEDMPRILVFACENDAYAALDMAGINHLTYDPAVRIIPVRCLGSLNLVWIADALSSGIDGILLLGCKHGEDYQCHFIKGSELANYRLSKISETLDRLALESDRVRMVEVGIMDYQEIPKIIDDFAARLEEIGPNPYKDF